MQPITVDSSMIHAVGYDPATEELEVMFTSGKIYRYTHVPHHVYDELLAADSKGSYMRACIIGAYPDYRVSGRRRS
ncbi:MAG: KTSC domain-containing protein [Chloroflexales bacterium]|nr:KTSC domain-containing protein [Chloroflexales bacterium]